MEKNWVLLTWPDNNTRLPSIHKAKGFDIEDVNCHLKPKNRGQAMTFELRNLERGDSLVHL